MFVAAIMMGVISTSIPSFAFAEEPRKENSTLVDSGGSIDNKENTEANTKEDMNVAGYGNKAKADMTSMETTNENNSEVRQKTELESTTQKKSTVHNADVDNDTTKGTDKPDVDEVDDSAYLQYDKNEDRPEDQKDQEPWFHISLKDIVFQLITAMIIFVIPGYVIFWRSKHK